MLSDERELNAKTYPSAVVSITEAGRYFIVAVMKAQDQLRSAAEFRCAAAHVELDGTPEQFAVYMDREIKKWDEIVRFSGAKIE
jgi:hypothetical protein